MQPCVRSLHPDPLVMCAQRPPCMHVQELEIAEKEERRLRREGDSKKERVKEEEEAGPSGGADGDGPTPIDTQMSGLDERSACTECCTNIPAQTCIYCHIQTTGLKGSLQQSAGRNLHDS